MRNYESYFDLNPLFAKVNCVKDSASGVHLKRKKKGGAEIIEAVIEKDNALSRRAGEYYTINLSDFTKNNYNTAVKFLRESVKREIKGAKKVLIVGMGNGYIISDSLGPKVVEKVDGIMIAERGNVKLAKIAPGVEASSGMESFEIVKAISNSFSPDVIIAVDSLCSTDHSRLGKSFQVSNAGIVPGSATGENKCTLTKEALGVKVVAIGVPLVVYLESVVIKALKNIKPLNHKDLKVLNSILSDAIYSPKEIDVLVEICARIISKGIEESVI